MNQDDMILSDALRVPSDSHGSCPHLRASFLSIMKALPSRSKAATIIPNMNGARKPKRAYNAPPTGGATRVLSVVFSAETCLIREARPTRLRGPS